MAAEDVSVRIDVPEGVWGSGVLYVPKFGEKAYILTAAHIFDGKTDNFEISVLFNPELAEKGLDEAEKKYYCKIVQPQERINEGVCRIALLDGYQSQQPDSPFDGALVEIPYKCWMRREAFEFGKAETEERLSGWGYPKTLKDRKQTSFHGWIERKPLTNPKNGEDRDYRISYQRERYSELLSTDTTFMNGFSGMGLFTKDKQRFLCVAVFSRDAGDSPEVFATDAEKLRELMLLMQKHGTQVFPAAELVDADDIGKSKASPMKMPLNLAFERFLEHDGDYLRILCGCHGAGKSYVTDFMKSKHADRGFEDSWRKLDECLSASDPEKMKDTVYILDPLERPWTSDERGSLAAKDAAALENEDGAVLEIERRLDIQERLSLLDKIERCSGKLKKYRIHVLIVCRSNYWKDVEKYLGDKGERDKLRRLQRRMIHCRGYDQKARKQILGQYKTEWPEYFSRIPALCQPQWMGGVLDETLPLPEPEEQQYDYEFRLYQAIADLFFEPNKGEYGEYVWELPLGEQDELRKLVERYVERDLKRCHEWRLPWRSEYFLMLWNYPFIEIEDGWIMEDPVMLAYLAARALNDWIEQEEEEKIIDCLTNVRRMEISTKTDPASGMGVAQLAKRIRIFLAKILGNEDSAGWRTLQNWFFGGEHEEYLEWLKGKTAERDRQITELMEDPRRLDMFMKRESVQKKKADLNESMNVAKNQDQAAEFQNENVKTLVKKDR